MKRRLVGVTAAVLGTVLIGGVGLQATASAAPPVPTTVVLPLFGAPLRLTITSGPGGAIASGFLTGIVLVAGPSINRPTTIEAVVSGDRMILKGRIPGTLTVSGEQMSGTADGVVSATITAQRQR
jgi:hypothetical protein